MNSRLVLVGPPGAGKSTVGELLASEMGVEFRDTDADIEATTGKAITDIFVEDGEAVFRQHERAAVTTALATHEGVLALGGGAILDPATRELLRAHTVIYLDVDLTHAAARVGLNRDRPLLIGNPRAQLKALMDDRRPLYEQAATHVVDTSGRSPDEIVAEVMGRVG